MEQQTEADGIAETRTNIGLGDQHKWPASTSTLLGLRTIRQKERPKVLFLHPKTLIDSWPFSVDSLGEIVKAPSAVYPVLAGVISDLPAEMEIFDGYVTRENFRSYKRRLGQADIIAISVMSPLKSLDTELTIKLAKRLNPASVVVLGGNQASSFPEEWLERGADFVVVGEGEESFRQLMETILTGSDEFESVPNLFYWKGTEKTKSLVSAAGADLNMVNLPRWDLFNFKPYELGTERKGFTAAVEVSRGCPHRCDFCSINTYWNYKQRYKSVERVCQELQQLHELGVRQFIFTDDNFAQNYRHTKSLFEEMIKRDFQMAFGSFMRGDTVQRHPELIALARQAGMRFCLMGIETLDADWLKDHGKGVRSHDVVAMYSKVYETLKRNRIFLIGLFINSPDGAAKKTSGAGADGVVCDFHYTADLVALKGSALYGTLFKQGAVGKNMFYHDWNLPSIILDDGSIQRNRTNITSTFMNNFAVWSLLGGSAYSRRFRWRHLGIFLERLVCSTSADVARYLYAKRTDLNLDERQRLIVESVLNEDFIDRLVERTTWRSPLSLRNGIWSEAPARENIIGHEERRKWKRFRSRSRIEYFG